MTTEESLKMYERLNWSHAWGQFMSEKFNTMKRFGLEGIWSFIPGLKYSIDRLVENGAETIILGMPHRGRLNLLANVVRKPMEVIFAESQGIRPDSELSDGFQFVFIDRENQIYTLDFLETSKTRPNLNVCYTSCDQQFDMNIGFEEACSKIINQARTKYF